MNDIAATICMVFFTGLICFGREMFCRRWRVLGVVVGLVGTAGLVIVYVSIQ